MLTNIKEDFMLSVEHVKSFWRKIVSIKFTVFFCSFRVMVIVSWLLTIIFSCPQAVIFRVLKHPAKEFYQCTTINFFEDLSEMVVMTSANGTNTTELALMGMTPDTWHNIYHTFVNCEIFFMPLIIIVISYARIYTIISM